MAAKTHVLIEVQRPQIHAFDIFHTQLLSPRESVRSSESVLKNLSRLGLEIATDLPPIPMLGRSQNTLDGLGTFSALRESPDMRGSSVVVSAEISVSNLDKLRDVPEVRVWPDSPITLLDTCPNCGTSRLSADPEPQVPLSVLDAANSAGGLDCDPYQPAVDMDTVRTLLGVERIWHDGFRGQNTVVGIVDNGVNGKQYPVVGGFTKPNTVRPGVAAVTSHGSMCAADVLLAAPAAKIYDYPLLVPRSYGALVVLNDVLDERRKSGLPQVVNNSWGYVAYPSQAERPEHEVWDLHHPVHDKIRELTDSGANVVFAAGNCGAECPIADCEASGPGKSINASNSLSEVLTVAAVNARHQRLGYSSQGPGMFEAAKPDVAAYSHFFGNFGVGRPGGTHEPYDSGTSAAAPVVSGVIALLLSAFPAASCDDTRDALIAGAVNIGPPGFDYDTGYGVINAAASYAYLERR